MGNNFKCTLIYQENFDRSDFIKHPKLNVVTANSFKEDCGREKYKLQLEFVNELEDCNKVTILTIKLII